MLSIRFGVGCAWILFLASAFAKLCCASPLRVFESPAALATWWGLDALTALTALPILCGLSWISARLSCAVTALACVWIALALPVARTLGTPPTWAMLAASGAPLRDSLQNHLQGGNAAWIGVVLVVAALAAALVRRVPLRLSLPTMLLWIPLALFRAPDQAASPTRGLERNALWTLFGPSPHFAFEESANTDMVAAVERARAFLPRSIDPALSSWRGAFEGASVVLVVLESAAARALGAWGAAADAMPYVSRLATTGLRMESTYATYPESIRGLIALFFALHPVPQASAESYRSLKAPSSASLLADAGYATALFHSGYFDYLGMQAIVAASGFACAEDAAKIGGASAASFGIPEDRTIERALQWIDTCTAGNPYALVYMPIAGHHPYHAPSSGPFEGSSEEVAWRNALHYADRCVFRLIEGVAARAAGRKVLVAIVGDHGQAFGEHPSNYGHSFFLFEENLRVPLLFHGLNLNLPAAVIPGVASHVDLLPTLLELLAIGYEAEAFDGRSLLDREGAAHFFADYGLPWIGMREGNWKWIQDRSSGREELYDLSVDPEERWDRRLQEPEHAAAMRARSEAWWSTQQHRMRRLCPPQ